MTLESDYSRPLSFSFDSKFEIVDVSITKSEPPNIGMVISKTLPYRAEMSPVLLNPNDTVTTRFIVIGDGSDSILTSFKVNGRVVGIQEVAIVMPSGQTTSVFGDNATILLAIGAMAGAVIAALSSVFTARLAAALLWIPGRIIKAPVQALTISSGKEKGGFSSARDGPWTKSVACDPSYHPGWSAIEGAEWVWIKERPSDQEAQKGQVVWHRVEFEISPRQWGLCKTAVLRLMVDDFADIYLNGRSVGDKIAIEQNIVVLDVKDYLRPGTNLMEVRVENRAFPQKTALDNPAGIIYRLDIR